MKFVVLKAKISMTEKIIRYLTDRNYRFIVNASRGAYNRLSDQDYIQRQFEAELGYPLDLKNPQTFNEKLQWLKLYDRKPVYTTMVDKNAVKEYVSARIGAQYVIPTLGIWDKFEDIDFSSLPAQFVLKCTHDSGGLVICRDRCKFDKVRAKKKLDKCLKRNYYYQFREWPYKDVRPRIIAEKYIEDPITNELRDFKFFCFGGVVKCYKIDFNRFTNHQANYYTTEGKMMKFGEVVCPPDFNKEIDIPDTIERMKELAGTLSSSIPFLRVDFYDVSGEIYFGELTFFPAAGLGRFIYDGNDKLLGSWINLPSIAHGKLQNPDVQ